MTGAAASWPLQGSPRRSDDAMAGRPWPLVAAVAGSLLVHLALLGWGLGWWMPRATLHSRGALIEARLIPAEPVPVAHAQQQPLSTAVSPVVRESTAPRPSNAAAASKRPTEAAAPSRPQSPPVAGHDAASDASKNASKDTPDDALAAGYRSVAELDPPPRPLGDIDPEYPAAAGLQSGTVVLRLLIGENGAVDDVTVVSATPPGLFEASAIAAFGKALFSPGRFLGMPVKSQLKIAVDYTPVNRGSAVSGQGGLNRGR
jgi:protein TonB